MTRRSPPRTPRRSTAPRSIAVDRESEKDGASTGYVLTDDPHYLVKIEKTDGDDTGNVVFSEFDEDFDVAIPSEDEIIDLDK